MKKAIVLFIVMVMLGVGGLDAAEIKPYVGLGYFSLDDMEFNNCEYTGGTMTKNNAYKMDSAPALNVGLLIGDKLKANATYLRTEGTNGMKYEAFSLSFDYLFWNIDDTPHSGMYIGLGGIYNSFDDDGKDFVDKGNATSLIAKVGFEFLVESILVDLGFYHNFCDERLSYVDSSSDTTSYDYIAPGGLYLTVNFVF